MRLKPPRAAFIIAALLGAALRLLYCNQLNTNTWDTLRHLHYGLFLLDRGPAAPGLSLENLALGGFVNTAWTHLPYNYPVLALAFFTMLAGICPTLAFAKLALTAIEALNACLIARITGDRVLGLIYWLSPLSIWWVSHEGQFEPLQNLATLLALWLLQARRPRSAFAMLALAIQVKLTAVVLLPWFILRARSFDPPALRAALPAFAAAFLPTLAVQFAAYPTLQQLVFLSAHLEINAWYWNPFNRTLHGASPLGILVLNQLATYGFLLTLAARGLRRTGRTGRTDRIALAAPILFLLTVKLACNAQPWYWLLWLPLLIPIPNPRLRLALFLLHPLLDITSLWQIAIGPIGHIESYKDGLIAPWQPLDSLIVHQ